MIEVFKQAAEVKTMAFEYRDKLAFGLTLSNGTLSAIINDTGVDATATLLASVAATISGTQARFRVQAGTSGVTYKVTGLITLSNGDTLEDEFLLTVEDI